MYNEEKIKKERERTLKHAMLLLKNNGKAIVVRPTGFGKTGITTNVIKSGTYKNIVFIYPADVVKQAVLRFYYGSDSPEDTIPGVTFITNQKLAIMPREEMDRIFNSVDLMIVDECHKMGGECVGKAIEYIMNTHPDMDLLGATATPERMDAIDIVGRFFEDIKVYDYGLHEAFGDGILQKPYYVYCAFARPEENALDLKAKLDAEINKIDDNRERLKIAEDLDHNAIEIANFFNMDKVIRRTVSKYTDTSYIKFIVFFSSFESLHTHKRTVEAWFHNAFPEMDINTLEVTSETKGTKENIGNLKKLTRKDGRIDLIMSIDQLNLGYHVEDLTGIIMYRGTESPTIYIQELGRALSSGDARPSIVLDVVDNLHNKSMYETLGRESVYTKNARKRKSDLETKRNKWTKYLEYRNGDTNDLTGNEIEDFKSWTDADIKENEFTSHDRSELNSLIDRFRKRNSFDTGTAIKQEDLIVVDIEAEYNDLSAKLIAEPLMIRTKQLLARFLELGGRIADQNGNFFTSKKQFLEAYDETHPPIKPFLETFNVNIEAVMGFLDIYKNSQADGESYTAADKSAIEKWIKSVMAEYEDERHKAMQIIDNDPLSLIKETVPGKAV